MRRFWFVLVLGCGGSPASTPVVRPTAPVATSELLPEVRPVPLPRPPRKAAVISRGALDVRRIESGIEDVILLGSDSGRRGRRSNEPMDVAERDFLSHCVREFVQAQPESARRPLIAAFTQYSTSCDGEGRVVLDHPLGPDGRDRRTRSDATFVGTLSHQGHQVSLRVAFCGGESAAPDHITIDADDTTWTSSRLEFQRDANTCDVAELPYTRALGRILLRTTDAETALIRFEGTNLTGELAIGDGMKRELRVVLDALDSL